MAISRLMTLANKTSCSGLLLSAYKKGRSLFATTCVREPGRKLVCAVALLLSAGNAGSADLIVSAAASLTNAFTAIGEAFEQAHPETTVAMNFAGSGQLLQQIARGAPVDVFASADQITMDRAEQENLIRSASRRNFVRNELVLIGPAGSNLEINSLADLRSDKVQRVAISNPASVPVGHYSKLSLQAAGLWEALGEKYINTQHVRQSLDYVARGEVDAGFVYATDARVMPGKIRVLMQVATSEPITYPIAVVADSRQAQAAERFVGFVNSTQGQAILRQFGFGVP